MDQAHNGGALSLAMFRRIRANILRETATSAIWNRTQRPPLTTFALILISFSRSVVSILALSQEDHHAFLIGVIRLADRLVSALVGRFSFVTFSGAR